MNTRSEFISGVFFFIFSLILLFFITPLFVESPNCSGMKASFFPNLASSILMVSSLVLILKSWKNKGKLNLKIKLENMKPLYVILAIFFHIILFENFGFLISTPIALIALMLIMGQRKMKNLFLNAFAVTGLLYALFAYVLKLNLT
ncbi:tripartite tricarboxylate transporter TctB family protein [uncultured Desulfuromusa sp.]|uniref:tripartite tricarboxylate transporter TctB family protein n=1 Tax=uncultured Desulfuromusa sp. TaxID=219183 RepID=UPI002AA7759F|nr:tripartite tricarboxylate transporter TctB family protein [uncultured Desulfuromusa sp.]